MLPVDAPLVTLTLLGADASIVNDAVKLFTCLPVVNTTRRCGHTPVDVRASTALSDRQCVISEPVAPSRNPELGRPLLASTPTTVTLVEPDDATFVIITAVGALASIVTAAVKLSIRNAVVIAAVRRVHTPVVALMTIALSECQRVACDDVPPTRADAQY